MNELEAIKKRVDESLPDLSIGMRSGLGYLSEDPVDENVESTEIKFAGGRESDTEALCDLIANHEGERTAFYHDAKYLLALIQRMKEAGDGICNTAIFATDLQLNTIDAWQKQTAELTFP